MWLSILITGKNVKRRAISPRVRGDVPIPKRRVGPECHGVDIVTQLILAMCGFGEMGDSCKALRNQFSSSG